MGQINGGNSGWDVGGYVEEVQVSNVARTATWNSLSYKNQRQHTVGSGVDSLTIPGTDSLIQTVPVLASYSANPATYITLMPITANTPTVSGAAPLTFTASPALPAGLSLNGSTGVITGAASSSQTQQTYTITVQNSLGSASIGLAITVNTAGPTMVTQPANLTVDSNATAKFWTTVSGTPPYEYRWTNTGTSTVVRDTTYLSNTLTDTLKVTGVTAANDGSTYNCQIISTQSLGSVTSNTATLNVAFSPGLVSPANGAGGVSTSPTLSWNAATGTSEY
jgi:hypothetical protein